MKNRKRKFTISDATPDLMLVKPYLKVRINTRHGIYFARLLVKGMNGTFVIYKKWLSLNDEPEMSDEEKQNIFNVVIPPESVIHTLQFTLAVNAKIYSEHLS